MLSCAVWDRMKIVLLFMHDVGNEKMAGKHVNEMGFCLQWSKRLPTIKPLVLNCAEALQECLIQTPNGIIVKMRHGDLLQPVPKKGS